MMQVPQRLYTLDELKLNGIEASSLLSPVDATLGSIERNLQLAAVLGGLSAWNVLGLQQILYFSLGFLFLWTLDSVIPLSLLSISSSPPPPMQDPYLKLRPENGFHFKIMSVLTEYQNYVVLFLEVLKFHSLTHIWLSW
jgi:hypothetical protein